MSQNQNDDQLSDVESISSSFSSSLSLIFGEKKSNKKERERSKSENVPIITHPHEYSGIAKISRGTQTTMNFGSPSIWSPKTKRNRILTNPRMIPKK